MSPRQQHRIEITLTEDRLAALDEARGDEARASFIKRAMDALIATTSPEAEGDGAPPPQWQRPSDTLPPLNIEALTKSHEQANAETRAQFDHLAASCEAQNRAARPASEVFNVSAKPAAAHKPRPKGKAK